MVNMDETFEQWLKEPMIHSMSRRKFAENQGISLNDLYWAFSSGWVLGSRQAVEDLQNV